MKKIITLLLFISVFSTQGQNVEKLFKYISKNKNEKALIYLRKCRKVQNIPRRNLLLMDYALHYLNTTPVAYDPFYACRYYEELKPNDIELRIVDDFMKDYGLSRAIIKNRIDKQLVILAKENIEIWTKESRNKLYEMKACISNKTLKEEIEKHEIRKELNDIVKYGNGSDSITRFINKINKIKSISSVTKGTKINGVWHHTTYIEQSQINEFIDSVNTVVSASLSASLSGKLHGKSLDEALRILKQYNYQNNKSEQTDKALVKILKAEIPDEINVCNCEHITSYRLKFYHSRKYLMPESEALMSTRVKKLRKGCEELKTVGKVNYTKAEYNLNNIPYNEKLSNIDKYTTRDYLDLHVRQVNQYIVIQNYNWHSSHVRFKIIHDDFKSHSIYRTKYSFFHGPKLSANLFEQNGIFIETFDSRHGVPNSNGFYYLNMKGCTDPNQNNFFQKFYGVMTGGEFRTTVNNKVYSFKINQARYTGNSQENYIIEAYKGSPIQGGANVFALFKTKWRGDKKSTVSSGIFNMGEIIENHKSPTKTMYYFNGDMSRTYTTWNLKDVFLLKTKNIAVVIELTENYDRYDPRIGLSIPHKFKTSLMVVFDGKGETILSANKIVEANQYIPSKNGGFYALVADGGYIVKYNGNAELEWDIALGYSDENYVKHDQLYSFVETNNKIYVGGYSLAKGYVGKKDPVIYEVSLANRSAKSHLINMSKYNEEIATMLLLNNDQLFYQIGDKLYNFHKRN